MTTLADFVPVQPAYTHAETVEIQPCAMDMTGHTLLVAIHQGGLLTPDVAPYRLVVHVTAVQLAAQAAYFLFGVHWRKCCEIAIEPSFGTFEWAIDCRDRRVHSEGA